MNKLENYITGKWVTGDSEGQVLKDAVNGEEIGIATTSGLDFASILHYARTVGNPALRKMTFHDRDPNTRRTLCRRLHYLSVRRHPLHM